MGKSGKPSNSFVLNSSMQVWISSKLVNIPDSAVNVLLKSKILPAPRWISDLNDWILCISMYVLRLAIIILCWYHLNYRSLWIILYVLLCAPISSFELYILSIIILLLMKKRWKCVYIHYNLILWWLRLTCTRNHLQHTKWNCLINDLVKDLRYSYAYC